MLSVPQTPQMDIFFFGMGGSAGWVDLEGMGMGIMIWRSLKVEVETDDGGERK